MITMRNKRSYKHLAHTYQYQEDLAHSNQNRMSTQPNYNERNTMQKSKINSIQREMPFFVPPLASSISQSTFPQPQILKW